jgi:hypothetical protein
MICLFSGFRHFGKHVLLYVTIELTKHVLLYVTIELTKHVLLYVTIELTKHVLLYVTIELTKHVLLYVTIELTKHVLLYVTTKLHNITALYPECLAFESLSRDHLLSRKASVHPSTRRRMLWDAVCGSHCGVIPHSVQRHVQFY